MVRRGVDRGSSLECGWHLGGTSAFKLHGCPLPPGQDTLLPTQWGLQADEKAEIRRDQAASTRSALSW